MDSGLGTSALRRLKLVALCGFSALAGLGWRFHQLQIDQQTLHAAEARLNTIVVERTAAPRGRIVDCKGRTIVVNEPTYQLWVRPAEVRGAKKTIALIARALGMPKAELEKRFAKAHSTLPLEPLVLKRSLSRHQLARCAVFLGGGIRGVYLEATARRRYHYGKSTAGVLGYMGEISEAELMRMRRLKNTEYSARDMVGKTGLEAQYDKVLRGRKGVENHYVDARGRTVRVEEARPPVPGPDLQLTLDMKLQTLAENLLRKSIVYPHGGAVVVMDPRSGRIRALASMPTFDPRMFARGITAKEYESLIKNPSSPLLSRAYEASFSPGSTFKPMTATAGLAEHICTPGSTFYCGGNYKGQNCFVRSGHGHLTLPQSLAFSCSVVFYQMADRLGIDRLAKYAHAYGFGQRTGIDLPNEDPGLFPDRKWKKKIWNDDWYVYDSMNTGIGQGMLCVTPLQMAVMTSAIANGGKVYKPFLVEKITTPSGGLKWQAHPKPVRKVPIKPQLLSVIREGMRGSVAYGTGAAAAVPGLEICGKTGTVETNGANHAWFESFAPYKNPKLVVVVFLEKSGGYGGSKAAPIAHELYKLAFGVKEK